MKKFFYATIVLALTSMLFFSCSKADELVVNDEDLLVKATLIAGNPQVNPASKTEIQGGTTPFWSVGDAIGVTNGSDSNQEFTTSITSASTTATFSGETVSGDLYAYYPYSAGGVSTAGASIALSAEQNPTPVSFDGSSDVLVSKMFNITPENTTVSGLQFKRLTSVLKVVIKNNDVLPAGEHPTFVSVEAESDLIGTVLVNFASQSLSLQSGASKKVTANYTSATQFEIDGTNAAYLVVLPQTLAAGTTLKITANTENYYIEKNITVPTGGIEILEGKITTLNIGMNSSTVTHHPVINVTSDNPMAVDNIADSYTINYSIDDPLEGEIISATTDASWISNINVSTLGEVTFDVTAQAINTESTNAPAPARTGYITLSYKDAEDVVITVNQKKGRILATLAITSSTNLSNLVDDKGNTWVCTSDVGVQVTTSNNNSYIQAGTHNNQHPSHLTLTLSGHPTYKIWAVEAWAAAQSKDTFTHISIGETEVVSSSALTNNASDGGSKFSVENDPHKTGDVVIKIQKKGNKIGKEHLYFNKLTILYDED
jgi:hypothetical protein